MITVDFVFRESSFARSVNQSLADVNAGIIEETYFLMPVRFMVNGVELLEVKPANNKVGSSPWLEIPLLGFAKIGEEVVKDACSGKQVKFYLPDIGAYLDFSPVTTDSIQIFSSINQSSSQIECDELQKEFSMFVSQVKKALSENIPDIINHPVIGRWIIDQS